MSNKLQIKWTKPPPASLAKNGITLSLTDFNIIWHNEDDVEVTEATGASEEVKEQMAKLEKLILPILYNLKKNPEKDYIVWDGAKRSASCEAQIQRILEITRHEDI